MAQPPRPTVVPFPSGSRPVVRAAAGGGGPGVVIRPWDDNDVDAVKNEAWDELLGLVDRAWIWRDPDTLSELEACLLRLGILVEADWA